MHGLTRDEHIELMVNNVPNLLRCFTFRLMEVDFIECDVEQKELKYKICFDLLGPEQTENYDDGELLSSMEDDIFNVLEVNSDEVLEFIKERVNGVVDIEFIAAHSRIDLTVTRVLKDASHDLLARLADSEHSMDLEFDEDDYGSGEYWLLEEIHSVSGLSEIQDWMHEEWHKENGNYCKELASTDTYFQGFFKEDFIRVNGHGAGDPDIEMEVEVCRGLGFSSEYYQNWIVQATVPDHSKEPLYVDEDGNKYYPRKHSDSSSAIPTRDDWQKNLSRSSYPLQRNQDDPERDKVVKAARQRAAKIIDLYEELLPDEDDFLVRILADIRHVYATDWEETIDHKKGDDLQAMEHRPFSGDLRESARVFVHDFRKDL